MSLFYLVRHAAKDVNGPLLTGRAPGVGLTDYGKRQVDALVPRLAGVPIDRLYCSPMERARRTAEPVAEALGLDLEVNGAFDEVEYGAWTNRSVDELEGDATWTAYNVFRSGTRIPDGESMHDVQTRFVGEMLRIRAQQPDATIAIFSHGDPIKAAVTYFAGMPLDFYSRLEIDYASITIVAVEEFGVRLIRLNEPALPPG